MPADETPPVPRPSRWSPRLPPGRSRVAWIGGGVALLLALLGITAAVAGPEGRAGGHPPASGGAAAPDAGSASPSASPSASASTSDSASASGGSAAGPGVRGSGVRGSGGAAEAPGSAAAPSPAPLVHPSLRLAPARARADAAAVLEADDSHYRQELTTGERLLGTTGFAAWSARTLADTTDRADTARAAAEFTASDQPPALIPWRADNGEGVAAVQRFARDAAGGSSIAVRTDADNALTALADADQLAQQVRAGD
ncbi:hypothetical protein [Streptacidiphilus sp. P02-A3a]|uniref:hypothetical protein n=1 Tax=Streptacidiphilus sp. P02-A3a TaxID=2704468 RepID=UPI0015FB774D|nr:hypothetical protein [Streptacidiphilus sp. P02-A3a]QMU68305.1 hypothetical protein GXP74_08760 [Streptacidiphilus sp. P02-A3a]